jgi:hypothetical protein
MPNPSLSAASVLDRQRLVAIQLSDSVIDRRFDQINVCILDPFHFIICGDIQIFTQASDIGERRRQRFGLGFAKNQPSYGWLREVRRIVHGGAPCAIGA